MRVIVWIALAILVYLALRKKVVNTQQQSRFTPPPTQTEAGETMVACATCQVFIPCSEAVNKNGQSYCCADHANSC